MCGSNSNRLLQQVVLLNVVIQGFCYNYTHFLDTYCPAFFRITGFIYIYYIYIIFIYVIYI